VEHIIPPAARTQGRHDFIIESSCNGVTDSATDIPLPPRKPEGEAGGWKESVRDAIEVIQIAKTLAADASAEGNGIGPSVDNRKLKVVDAKEK
jgi:hypothetical protein